MRCRVGLRFALAGTLFVGVLCLGAFCQTSDRSTATGNSWSGHSAFADHEVAPRRASLRDVRPLDSCISPPPPHFTERKIRGVLGSEGPLADGGVGNPSIATPNMLRTWTALSETGRLPDGVDIAVGKKYVIIVTGNRLAVYSKRGDLVAAANINSLLGTNLFVSEPRALYDDEGDTFVIVFLGFGSNPAASKHYVFVTRDDLLDSGLEVWWWVMDAYRDGNYATHTSMGDNTSHEVCIANDMYSFATGTFRYAQCRYLPKSKLRTFQPIAYFDYWGMTYDGSYAQRLQVAEVRQNSPYWVIFAATKLFGGDNIRVWTTQGPFSGPFSVTERSVGCWAYTYPPDAPQFGSSYRVPTGFAWLTSAVHADGQLLLSHTIGYDFSGTQRPIMRVYKFGPTSTYADWQQQVGWQHSGAYIPVADFDSVLGLYAGFNYSNTGAVYPSTITMSKTADPWLSGYGWIASGQAPYTRPEWVQYAGSSPDGKMWGIVWMAHMNTRPDGTWEIGVGEMSHYHQPDATPPYGWPSTPDHTLHTQQPIVSCSIRDDESGLYPPSGTYRYSKDAGQTWTQVSHWQTPLVSGDWGSNAWEVFRTYPIPFNQDSMTRNLVTFSVEDMYRNYSWSPVYVIPIDTRPPEDWAGFQPDTIVNGGVLTCSVMVHDVTSGLNVISAYYRFSTNRGSTWSGWAPAACTGTNGTTDYQTIIAPDVPFMHRGVLGENLIQFRIQDMFGNEGVMTYSVRIDKLARLEGKISLADFLASPLGTEVTLEQYNGSALMETVTTTLRSDGGYVVWFKDTGGTHIRVKTSHHLSRRVAKVLSGAQTNFLDVTLPYNGDGDGNNQIGLPDLNLVMVNFTKARNPADYNGSGQVDLPDMNLVLLNFTKTGE